MSARDEPENTADLKDWTVFHEIHRARSLTEADFDRLIHGVLHEESWNALEKVQLLDLLLLYSIQDSTIALRYQDAIVALLNIRGDEELVDCALQILRAWGMESLWKPVVKGFIRKEGAASHREGLMMLVVGLRNSYELLADPEGFKLFKVVYEIFRGHDAYEVFRRLAYDALAAVVLEQPPAICDGRRATLYSRTYPTPLTLLIDVDPVVVALIERRVRFV